MFCFLGFHSYSKWTIVKKAGIFDDVILYKIRVCKNCGSIDETYIGSQNIRDCQDIPWYFEYIKEMYKE